MNISVQTLVDEEWVTVHTVWAHIHEVATKKAIAWAESVFRISSGVKLRLWQPDNGYALGGWNLTDGEWASMPQVQKA